MAVSVSVKPHSTIFSIWQKVNKIIPQFCLILTTGYPIFVFEVTDLSGFVFIYYGFYDAFNAEQVISR